MPSWKDGICSVASIREYNMYIQIFLYREEVFNSYEVRFSYSSAVNSVDKKTNQAIESDCLSDWGQAPGSSVECLSFQGIFIASQDEDKFCLFLVS